MIKKRKRRLKSYEIIQKHHLEYLPNEEIIVKITRTEHFFCFRIENYAKAHGLTKGFIGAMNYYYKKYKK